MKTISTLGAVVVSIYFVAVGSNAYGQNAVPSDELLITDLGVPIFDQLIAEPGPGAVETSLTWAPAAVAPLPPLVAATVPGASIVILTEPANEPLDPGEIPITIVDKATGATLTVSDVVISTLSNQVQAPTGHARIRRRSGLATNHRWHAGERHTVHAARRDRSDARLDALAGADAIPLDRRRAVGREHARTIDDRAGGAWWPGPVRLAPATVSRRPLVSVA